MRIKKTCFECRALRNNGNGNFTCDLGYQIKVTEATPWSVQAQPIEVCPKPKTYQAFISLKNRRR